MHMLTAETARVYAAERVYYVIIVPFLIFLVTTVVRDAINAPRPYEKYDIVPVFPKSTKGHSCPSRHTACAFAVAFAWLWTMPAVGIVLLVAAVLVAVSRPLCGVHFPLDVVFGFVIAVITEAAGILAGMLIFNAVF